MKKLFAIEFAKLWKLNSLRVILVLYFALSPLVVYALYGFFNTFMGPMLAMSGGEWNPFTFPDVWSFVTYSSSYFNVLMGVIIVIVMTNEYNFKTLKQNVIDGMSLRQVIGGKFLVVFILSTVVTLYTFIMGMIYGLINSESGTEMWEGFSAIPVYYLQTLCYFSFAFFFATIVKRTALAIIFFIVSFIVETIIGGMLAIAKLEVIYAFFPLNSFSKLTPFPILKEMVKAAQERSGNVPFMLDSWVNILVCLFYMTFFFLISLWVIKRRDL